MSDNPAVATNEYVSNEALERVQSQVSELKQLVASLSERMDTSLGQQLADMEERLFAKIDESNHAIRTELDDKVGAEHQARIESEHNLAQRFDALSDDIEGVSKIVHRFDGTIGNWNRVLDSANANYTQAQRRLDDTEDRLEQMANRQNLAEEKHRQLHKTIHGDASEDGPTSLFKAISNLSETVSREFRATSATLKTVLSSTRNNANAIEKIERERAQEKERWSKRLTIAKDYTSKAMATPWLWITLIVSVVGLFVTINPASQDFFTKLIAQIFAFFRP